MFHAATVPGIPPSELSPRKNRVPLSRPLAPLQLSTGVQECTVLRLVASGFTDAHAFTQLPGSPDDYELPFRRAEARFPVVLDSRQRNHSIPPASPTSELCSPRESVRNGSGLPLGRWSMLSWVSPLRSFLRPRPRFSPRPIVDRARSRDRDIMGPAAPCCRVRPSRARVALEKTSSTASNPFTRLARAASRRRPLLSWPWSPSKLGFLTFRALRYVESGVLS